MIAELLADALAKKDQERYENRPKYSHAPSEMDECLRKLFYKWLKIPQSEPMDRTSILRVSMGNTIHMLLQDALSGHDVYDFQPEVDFQADLTHLGLKHPMRGRVDGILTNKQTGEKTLLEIKSTFGFGARKLVPGGAYDETHQGLQKYATQLWAYLTFGVPDATNAALLIVNRETMDITEWAVERYTYDYHEYAHLKRTESGITFIAGGCEHPFPDTDMLKSLQRLQRLELHLEANTLPDRDFYHPVVDGRLVKSTTINGKKVTADWQCTYCQWRSRCWLDDN